MYIFMKSFLIGLSIAIPVGPIGLLCIRNSLSFGMRMGLITGLGAALADAIFGALAGFGFYSISKALASFQTVFQIAGALFVCYLGIITFVEKPKETDSLKPANTYARTFFSTFLLTLTNPMTILSFAAIYATLGASSSNGVLFALIMTSGVFLGSLTWWFFLSCGVSFFKDRINLSTKKWLNRISGATLLSFGVFNLIT
jgi:threonine/homoserine/homoserine lactone efflux protein